MPSPNGSASVDSITLPTRVSYKLVCSKGADEYREASHRAIGWGRKSSSCMKLQFCKEVYWPAGPGAPRGIRGSGMTSPPPPATDALSSGCHFMAKRLMEVVP